MPLEKGPNGVVLSLLLAATFAWRRRLVARTPHCCCQGHPRHRRTPARRSGSAQPRAAAQRACASCNHPPSPAGSMLFVRLVGISPLCGILNVVLRSPAASLAPPSGQSEPGSASPARATCAPHQTANHEPLRPPLSWLSCRLAFGWLPTRRRSPRTVRTQQPTWFPWPHWSSRACFCCWCGGYGTG